MILQQSARGKLQPFSCRFLTFTYIFIISFVLFGTLQCLCALRQHPSAVSACQKVNMPRQEIYFIGGEEAARISTHVKLNHPISLFRPHFLVTCIFCIWKEYHLGFLVVKKFWMHVPNQGCSSTHVQENLRCLC